jgi:hypothetical protein
MWFVQSLIVWGFLCLAVVVFTTISAVMDSPKTKDTSFTKKEGAITLSIVFILMLGVASFAGGMTHSMDLDNYNQLIKAYSGAVLPCIEESQPKYDLVDCNVAYQLEQYDYTVEDYNSWVGFFSGWDTDWWEKYSGIVLPDYVKKIVVNGSCTCEGCK